MPVLAQFLAQVMYKAAGCTMSGESEGPTKAQRGYEGRKDLWATRNRRRQAVHGRDVIQATAGPITRSCPKWAGPDFEAKPLLESPEWLGIGGDLVFPDPQGPDRPRPRRGTSRWSRAG